MRNETLFSEKTLRAFEKLKISMYIVTEATKTFGEAIKNTNQKRFTSKQSATSFIIYQ